MNGFFIYYEFAIISSLTVLKETKDPFLVLLQF
jgi:hypothetical protein